MKKNKPLFTNTEWDFTKFQSTYDAIEEIAVKEMGYNIFTNQLEVVSSEQMLDAMSSIGMPIHYHHWSNGKRFIQENNDYKFRRGGIPLEMIINSNPCISYNVEDNSMTAQAMVLAHAAMGHNHFFKNNYLFKQWTDPDNIIDYMAFAKEYIAEIEAKEGQITVEKFIDSCHALMEYGINKYKHPEKLSMVKEKKKQAEREEYIQSQVNVLYTKKKSKDLSKEEKLPKEPEENLLYFFERYAPLLKPWQREIIRIVRKTSQYFYPQSQEKMSNEGFACWSHYTIMNRLHEKGLITDGSLIEFFKIHGSVIAQFSWNSKYFNGLNPYRLGFEIYRDVERMCKEPTDQDKHLFPSIAGGDYLSTIKDMVANYRDESLIRQFLSPKVVKDLRLFHIYDEKEAPYYVVEDIQDMEGFEYIREKLANQHENDFRVPSLEVTYVSPNTKKLTIKYTGYDGRSLANIETMMDHVKYLWTAPVEIIDKQGNLIIQK